MGYFLACRQNIRLKFNKILFQQSHLKYNIIIFSWIQSNLIGIPCNKIHCSFIQKIMKYCQSVSIISDFNYIWMFVFFSI